MTVTSVKGRSNVYQVVWNRVKGLAVVEGNRITLSPNLRDDKGRSLVGMVSLRDAIARAA